MKSIDSLGIALAGLTLLVAACAPDTETQAPPQTAEVTPVVETSTAAGSVRPEDLLRNGRMPFADEMILVGGQPKPDQLETVQQLGYRTIINLRTAEEADNTDPEQVRALGMTYVAFPIQGSADLTEAKARAFAEALEAAERPVMVHCSSGNRVGGLFAMKAHYVDGLSPREALEVGKQAGVTRAEATVRERLGLPAQ